MASQLDDSDLSGRARLKRARPEPEMPEPSETSLEQQPESIDSENEEDGTRLRNRRSTAGGRIETALQGIKKRAYKKTKNKPPRKPNKQFIAHGYAKPIPQEEPLRDGASLDAAEISQVSARNDKLDLAVPYLPTFDGRSAGPLPLPLIGNIHKAALRLAKALRYPLFQRWVRCAFFYPSIDQCWYARNEWCEWLCAQGCAHVRKATRAEWAGLRKKAGKARRFSIAFTEHQRDSLHVYRAAARAAYANYSAPVLPDGSPFPYAIPGPIRPGARVTAIHPLHKGAATGTVQYVLVDDGQMLRADASYFERSYVYQVSFDRPADGSWHVHEAEVMGHGEEELLHPFYSHVPQGVAAALASIKEGHKIPIFKPGSISAVPRTEAGVHTLLRVGYAPPPNLAQFRAAALSVQQYAQPSSALYAVSATNRERSSSTTADPASDRAGTSDAAGGTGSGSLGGGAGSGGGKGSDAPMAGLNAIGTFALGKEGIPLVAAGQPVRVQVGDGYDMVLRAFATIHAGEGTKDANGPPGQDELHQGDAAAEKSLLLDAGESGVTPFMSSLLSRPLARISNVHTASASMPLVSLHSIGPDTASVVALAAHCGSVLATARAETVMAVARTQLLLRRKQKVLHAIKSKVLVVYSNHGMPMPGAQAQGAQNPVLKALMANPSFTWLLDCLTSVNASLDLHMSTIHQLQRVQSRAAEGADSAIVASGLSAPARAGADCLGLGRGPTFSHDGPIEGDSPFISVALSAARSLVHDPTGTGKVSAVSRMGTEGALPNPQDVALLGTALMLEPASVERIDAITARSGVKAAPVLAGATRDALLLAAGCSSAATAPADVKATANAATGRIILGQSTGGKDSDMDGLFVSPHAPPASRKALQAMQLALVLQADVDPRAAAATYTGLGPAGDLPGSDRFSSPAPSTGLSPLESFLAVQRALHSLAPVHATNRQVYDDLVAAVAGLRASVAAV